MMFSPVCTCLLLALQVRKAAAGKLFETVLMFDDLVSDDNMDELNALLSETQW